MELEYTNGLSPFAERIEGSNPSAGTIKKLSVMVGFPNYTKVRNDIPDRSPRFGNDGVLLAEREMICA